MNIANDLLLTEIKSHTAELENLLYAREEHLKNVEAASLQIGILRNQIALKTAEMANNPSIVAAQVTYPVTGNESIKTVGVAPKGKEKSKPKATESPVNFHYPDYPTHAVLVERMMDLFPEFLRRAQDWRLVKNNVWTADRIRMILRGYSPHNHDASLMKLSVSISADIQKATGDKNRIMTKSTLESRLSTLLVAPEVNTKWSAVNIHHLRSLSELAFSGLKDDDSCKEFGRRMATLAMSTASPVDSIWSYVRGAVNVIAVERRPRTLEKVQAQFAKQQVELLDE